MGGRGEGVIGETDMPTGELGKPQYALWSRGGVGGGDDGFVTDEFIQRGMMKIC